jgi:hypothetical protein
MDEGNKNTLEKALQFSEILRIWAEVQRASIILSQKCKGSRLKAAFLVPNVCMSAKV